MEIELREIKPEDFDEEYLSWYQNSDGHLNFFTGSGRSFDMEALLKDYKSGLENQKWFYYMIIDKNDGVRIGNVKIGPIDLVNKTSDLVCLIGNRSYLGKGIASKAISLANKIAFDVYDIRRLHGGMFEHNIPSIKAYTKAGWEIEATMKGFYFRDGTSVDRVCVCCLNPKYFS